jgi:rhodanese-related sulfurtransferase
VVAAGVVDHNTPDELVAQGRLIGSGTVTAMIPEIDTDALAGALEGGSARLFDVREADEFEAGHVPGARSLPLSELPERLGELAGDGPTYLICGIGARSLRACEIASLAGVETINVAGGTRSWVESGRPIVVGDQ